METITFTDHTGKAVTRSYKTPEALLAGLKRELQKVEIRRQAAVDAAEREKLSKASCDLMLAIYNNSGPFNGRRVYGDPDIEIR